MNELYDSLCRFLPLIGIANFQRWGKQTFDFLLSLYQTHGADQTGIMLVSGYEIWSSKQPRPFWADDVIGFQELNEQQLTKAGHKGKFGWFYTSIIIDVPIYMKWMHK